VPNPAPESLMLSAMQTELQKIGTAPTDLWNTQTPPVLRLGYPGDAGANPNTMTMWLQHIGTEFLDAEGGISTHRIKATFAVHCESSHAIDSMDRVLGLINDVRRVMFAAERTMFASFDGGIWPGLCQFVGPDPAVRSGSYLAEQQFSIIATVQHDGSLADDPSMLSYDYERTLLRIYPFTVLPTIERVDGANMQQRLTNPGLILETLVQASNKIVETRIEQTDTSFSYPTLAGPNGEHWSQYMLEIACLITPGIAFSVNATAFVGVEIGTMDSAQPFPASPGHPVVQLRWNYGTQVWQLVSAAGDGTAAVIVPLVLGSAQQTVNGGARVRLLYDPFARKIQAFVNGVLGAEMTTQAALPLFRDLMASALMFGAFATSGQGGCTFAATLTAAHCKLFNRHLPAATLWY